MSDPQAYPLGHSRQEQSRLVEQAGRLGDFTEDLLRRAGLDVGMDVLDIGSGVGDVSFLCAEIVGPSGRVTGVERAATFVTAARRRAEASNLTNVKFEEDDLATFDTGRKFDAIVGRFVLSYLPDRDDILRKLVRHLRPGGIVASIELDMSQIAQVPASELFNEVRGWILGGFGTGAELDMGSRLYATYRRAGLPAPAMITVQPVAGGPTALGYAELAQALRSLLPTIERSGIADVRKIDIDTLAERLRDDAAAQDSVLFMGRIVGAWSRLV